MSLGEGNDFLRLEGSLSDSYKLDGGLADLVDFDHGDLGDILSLAPSLAKNPAQLGGLTADKAVNFETLHLDLADGNEDVLDVDSLLHVLAAKDFQGTRRLTTLS